MENTTAILKGSIELESIKKHLSNMLDEWEAQYEDGADYSWESMRDYVDAAKFMKDHGRKFNLIAEVKESMTDKL